MKHFPLVTFLIFCTILVVQAQPAIQWQKCLGGSGDEDFAYTKPTSDGGFIVSGQTMSNDGDALGNHGDWDLWVGKLSNSGSLEWQKCLGGSNEEYGSVEQSSDGGYIVAASTESNDGDVSGHHGGKDIWVVKLSSSGSIQWQKCLGGSDYDNLGGVREMSDGGYIVYSSTESNDGDVAGHHGERDIWVVKLSSTGSIQWQKCLGGSENDYVNSVEPTGDGGYLVSGQTDSNDGDVSGVHNGADIWIAKLDNTGTVLWQKCLGGSQYDFGSAEITSDGGYIISGISYSNDGDVSGNHGGSDAWVVKLNSTGTIEWQKSLGGSEDEYAHNIAQTSDGGFMVTGAPTESNDGDISGNHGGMDAWALKLSSNGMIEWQKCLGGSSFEDLIYMESTSDGGYLFIGITGSNDGDVTGYHGGDVDIWMIKINNAGSIKWQKCLGGSDLDAAFYQKTSDDEIIISGYTNSNDGDVSGNHGGFDFWLAKLSGITSTQELENNYRFQVYPNPTTGELFFSIENEQGVYVLEISDALGRLLILDVELQLFPAASISIENLLPGIYYYTLSQNSMVVKSGKIVRTDR